MSENHFIPNSYHSIKNFFNVAILFFSFKYALRLIALELMRIMEMEEGISWFGQKYRSRLWEMDEEAAGGDLKEVHKGK